MFYDYNFLLANSGDNLSNDLKQNDLFYVKLDADYNVIKLELILSLIDNVNTIVDCKIYSAYKSNFLCIKYYRKINLISVNNNLGDLENAISLNSSKIDENKNNISTNLININGNENNMAYNLSEINYIKNNIPKSYLKNIYNILIHDEKTQIDFKNIFYENIFDIKANKNDFIEMNFKIDLEYEDISERSYIKTQFEIFDENDNSLYVKLDNINKYLYLSNRVIINENIFYDFNNDVKKIKFVIKFQKDLPRIVKIWYIKNDNYRLILTHFGN